MIHSTEKPNGKTALHEVFQPTGMGAMPGMVPGLRAVSIEPWEPTPPTHEHIGVRELYTFFSAVAGDFVSEAPRALISQIVGESLNHLRGALHEDDQITRENHLAIGLEVLCRISRFVGTEPNFDDLLSVLLVAITAHRTTPYSLPQIKALVGVVEKIKKNPIPSETDLSTIYDTLDSAGFDLNAPLEGVDLHSSEPKG